MPPLRRCVGCGRIAPKSELIRIAVSRAEDPRARRAVCDPANALPGRGAYLCLGERPALPAGACLQEAIRRRAIARGLRSAVSLDSKLVESVS